MGYQSSVRDFKKAEIMNSEGNVHVFESGKFDSEKRMVALIRYSYTSKTTYVFFAEKKVSEEVQQQPIIMENSKLISGEDF